MQILIVVLGIAFWAAVFSFIPSLMFLFFHPLYSIRAEQAKKRGIFLLAQETQLTAEKKKRLKGLKLIYAVCVWFSASIYFINWIQRGMVGIMPFDILSTMSVLLFCFAIFSYLPFAFYVFVKNPWRYKDEGMVFTKIFILYGTAILIFSFSYACHWIKMKNLFIGMMDVVKSMAVMIIGATGIAYIPILLYVFLKLKNPFRSRPLNWKIIFVIYSLSFVLFAVVYVTNWYSDRLALHKGSSPPEKVYPSYQFKKHGT